ncbi:MAG: DUF3131 domain-containing protein [Clostridia bacterium]|nr:DUF3131 domain-containing protein [Clostridia bacterium]
MQGLKEELLGSRNKEVRYRVSSLLSRIRQERDRVERGDSSLSHSDGVWLLENYYLIERCAGSVKRVSPRVAGVTDAFVRRADALNGESVGALFEVLSEMGDKALESARDSLVVSCLASICDFERVGEKIELLRSVSNFDFTPFLQGFSEAERYLRADPSGVWQKMGRESRALYRRHIEKMARRSGEDFTAVCRSISRRACERGCHIGELIDFGGRGYLYYFLNVLVFLLLYSSVCLTVGFTNVARGLICFCLILPLWETSVGLSAFLISLFQKGDILPRVEVDSVGEDIATLVSVTCLVSSPEEAEGLVSHLERLYFKSRSRRKSDEGLYLGLLADMPEGDSPILEGDEAILSALKRGIDDLNSRHGGRFSLFTRDRVLFEGRYTYRERKRGALLELAGLVRGKRSALHVYGARLPLIKYIVTLDSDTDMPTGALSELVGTMEHPLNRPVLSETGTLRVVRGYGILQPVIQPSLFSSFKTPFSLLISGAGGLDTYHGPVFDLYHTLFRRSMFCGKGIFDAEVYYRVLSGAFPDGIVLSHDMLEGSRLRAGLMPDIAFVDSVPQNVLSYFKRAHRWARGDVQALVFTQPRVTNCLGERVKNPQPLSDRWVFLQNVLNLFSPVFSCLALALALTEESSTALAVLVASLSPLWLYSVIQLVGALCRLTLVTLFRRFFTEALTGIAREIVQLAYSFSSLFFRAWTSLSAIATSVWRMAVSGRGLLEWSTAGQVESGTVKRGGLLYYFLSTLPSFIVGVLFLVLSTNGATRLTGLAWTVFFLVGFLTSRPRVRRTALGDRERRLVLEYLRASWKFFETAVGEDTAYLPPDNMSVSPSNAVAYRTSPTNIGMYLLSALAVRDVGIIDDGELFDRVERALDTLESLPRHRGHFYNWYDLRERCVVGREYISTVDSGNLTVSLMTLAEGLSELKCERARALAERVRRLEREADMRMLYDNRRHLFSIGYDVERDTLDSGCYDLYMSEMRTTDYYAVARGIVESEHWSRLSRSPVARRLTVGSASWSGTAFEYFMPHLFLPVAENSFCDEALAFAFAEQVEFSSPTRCKSVWGTSESGYFAFDRDMNYQYRAFGVPTLALSRDAGERVVSPYSSFLMLFENPKMCVENLERLRALGLWGEFGFYEAVDFSPSRTGGGFAPVKSYMAHHVGMSIIASANLLLDGIFRRRFMRDPEMNASVELLCERIPVDAIIMRQRGEKPTPRRAYIPVDTLSVCRNRERRCVGAVAGRDIVLLAGERGVESIDTLGISALRGSEISFLPYFKTSSGVYSPLTDCRVQFVFGRGIARYKLGDGEISINASSESPAIRVRIIAEGERGLYFEPSAVVRSAFVSHPAFADLFFEGWVEDGRVILEYHGRERLYICLGAGGDFEFELFREKIFEGREAGYSGLVEYLTASRPSNATGTLLSPCIFARQRGGGDSTFVVGWGRSVSEAVSSVTRELERSSHKSYSASDKYERGLLSACEMTPDRIYSERLLSAIGEVSGFYPVSSLPEHIGRERLWELGISGDLPIVTVWAGVDFLEKIIRLHKLHYIEGIRYDLVILCRDVGYMRGERDRAESLLDLCRARFTLGISGGIFIVGGEAEEVVRYASRLFIENEAFEPISSARLPEGEVTSFKKGDGSGFSERGYTVDKGYYNPKILWHHIIASDTFGTLVTTRSLGHCWVFNAGLSRLDKWENDRVGGGKSEKLFLLKKSGALDLCASASRVSFEAGRAVYHSEGYTVTVACHPTLLYKEVRVSMTGRARLLYSLSAVMGDGVSRVGRVLYHRRGNGIVFKNPFGDTLRRGFGYLYCVGGEAFDTPLGLEAEGEGELRFILGYAGSDRHFETVLDRVNKGDCEAESVEYAERFIRRESTLWEGDYAYMYNRGLPLQCAVSRVLARTGPYQSGGAWGGRDQAQDMLFLIDLCPERVRAHLFRIASHQYLEGDIQHWWHGFRGTRTLCSDDYLWFVLLLSVYFEKTGDESLFDYTVRYLESDGVSGERYELPSRSQVCESLLSHAVRALDLFIRRGVGAHGIPLALGGDWNDGMNRIGEGGGESVWLGFFAISVFYKAFPMLEHFGVDTSEYRKFCRSVFDAIEKNAFFTDRYARAFLGDGTPLGVKGCEACELDGMVTAFASICYKVSGLGNPSRISASLDTAWRLLWEEKHRLYRLFTPPFTSSDSRVGYVSDYPEGVRENGGQYTHGAVFSALGYLWAPSEKKKNFKRCRALLDCILPLERDSDVFMTEPYVLSADIYSNPTHKGRGGWSFYTGSAGWCRYLMSEIEKRNISERDS